MPTDPRLLTLAQWLSPAFPTGSFAFSHGLETAFREGCIADADGLTDWLRGCLTEGAGRSDAIWLRLAFASDDIAALDAEARTFAVARERLREADRQGTAFARAVSEVWGLDLPPLLLPLAIGRAARLAGLDVEDCVALYLNAFVTNLALAATRLAPIGQSAAQRVIRDLQPVCLAVADETRGATIDDICGNAFLSDIAAMRHETLEARLFQS